MTHANCPADDKKKVGITENLIRLSIGLEDPKDLTDDLNQSLSALCYRRTLHVTLQVSLCKNQRDT